MLSSAEGNDYCRTVTAISSSGGASVSAESVTSCTSMCSTVDGGNLNMHRSRSDRKGGSTTAFELKNEFGISSHP